MRRTAFWSLILLVVAGCSDPVGGVAEVEQEPDEFDLWISPCCFLTYAHAQTQNQQSLAPGDTLQVNVAYLTQAGAVRDLTAASTFTFDPVGRVSVTTTTVACTADPTKRCRVLTNHGTTPGDATVVTVEYKGNTDDLVVTTVAGS